MIQTRSRTKIEDQTCGLACEDEEQLLNSCRELWGEYTNFKNIDRGLVASFERTQWGAEKKRSSAVTMVNETTAEKLSK